MVDLPPRLSGWPLVGNFLEYRRDHVRMFWRGYQTLGPVFSIGLGPQRAVVLIGPENHRFFFAAADRELSLPEVYRFVIPMFGPVLNASTDLMTRRAQLALLHSAFQGERMERHVRVMAQETANWLAGLGEAGEFELYDTLATLGMNIAAAALIGPEVRARMDEFCPLFHDLARGMDFILPPNLPLPRFRRRDRARRKLSEMVRPVVAARRAHRPDEPDFLQVIVDGYGRGVADEETVVGLALMTVFTGYIATAAQTCWAVIELLQHSVYLEAVRNEGEAVLGDHPEETITVRTLAKLDRLEWALKESQRLHPAMSHHARFTAREYELGGYRIPPGWLTMICPAVSHRLPGVFTEPDTFDPERFAPGREEDRKTPYSLVGFGGGVYRCPGAGFGTFEMKTVLSLMLAGFDLTLQWPNPGRDYTMGVTRPQCPCRVRYRRRGRCSDRHGAEWIAVSRGTKPAQADPCGTCPVVGHSDGTNVRRS